MFASSALQTLMLPLFRNNSEMFSHIPFDVVTLYTFVAGCGVLGRLIGGAVHYWFKYPVHKKFLIAISVYTTVTILEAVDLYLPVYVMMISMFIEGILGVTSYNIRISATQSYVPDTIRGRFNGAFQMLCSVGTIVGQLIIRRACRVLRHKTDCCLVFMRNQYARRYLCHVPGTQEHVKKDIQRTGLKCT
jgi:predicted MFS family arabinose efflux permease